MTKSPMKPNKDLRPEPDEPGEGTLLRDGPDGGPEVRVTQDHGDPPLGEQMARTEERAFGGDRNKKPRLGTAGTPPAP